MSDPQPDSLEKKPQRAEPLQPDNPASGDSKEPGPAGNEPAKSKTSEIQREQADTARENVTKGYD